MRYFILFLISITAFTCSNTPTGDGETVDISLYEVTNVPGSNVKQLLRKDANGKVMEEGLLQDGLKTGPWVTYVPERPLPKTVVTYVDGKATGLYLEFNDNGQLQTKATYLNNKLHGPYARFRFGRPTHEGTYFNGEIDGIYREYYVNNGQLHKEFSYKNGVLDGPYRFYDEQGGITLELMYKNGEKMATANNGSNADNPPQ